MEWAVDTMIRYDDRAAVIPYVVFMLHANVPPMLEWRSIAMLMLDVIPPLCPRSPEDVSNQKSEVDVLYWSLTYGTPPGWEWSSVPRMPRIASVSPRRCSSGLFLDKLLWVDSGWERRFLLEKKRESKMPRDRMMSCSLGVRASEKGCCIGIIATVVN